MDVITNGNRITVVGQVAKFDDYDKVKLAVEAVKAEGSGQVSIEFRDAQSLISALIGYLIKLVKVDRISLTVVAGNPTLHGMLDTLALIDVLNVKKG